MQSNIRLFWLLLGIAGIILAVFPLSSLALDMFDIYGVVRPFRGQDVVFFDLCAIVGIAVAIAIQYFWRPFGFIHVLLVDYVSGYFFITAVVLALLVYIVRGMAPLPVFRQTTKQIVLGILLWFFLYITLGQLVTFAWQRLTFTLPRLWRFVLVFLIIWPLFLLDEGINRGYQEEGTIRAIASSVAFKVLTDCRITCGDRGNAWPGFFEHCAACTGTGIFVTGGFLHTDLRQWTSGHYYRYVERSDTGLVHVYYFTD